MQHNANNSTIIVFICITGALLFSFAAFVINHPFFGSPVFLTIALWIIVVILLNLSLFLADTDLTQFLSWAALIFYLIVGTLNLFIGNHDYASIVLAVLLYATLYLRLKAIGWL